MYRHLLYRHTPPLLCAMGGASIYAFTTCATQAADVSIPVTTALHHWNENNTKRAIVIGAGVAGVSSAFALSKRGYEVVVIDSRSPTALECSAVAAGGMQLSNPVVNRTSWLNITTNVFSPLQKFWFWKEKKDSRAFQYFYLKWTTLLNPHFLRWSALFAYNSLWEPKVQLQRQEHMLAFTTWAISQFKAIENQGQFQDVIQSAGINTRGAMMLHENIDDENLKNGVEETVLLDIEAAVKVEPFLKSWPLSLPPVASYQPNALSGNSELYTLALAKQLAQNDSDPKVSFYYNTSVTQFVTHDQKVTSIHTSQGAFIEAEHAHVVVAAGSWTPQLLWHLDAFTPVYPLKGYCVLLDNVEDQGVAPPKGIITDGILFFSQLQGQLRIASIGEFAGWKTSPTPKVDAAFRKHLEKFDVDVSNVPTRCGLRPMVADGAVLIGAVSNCKNVSEAYGRSTCSCAYQLSNSVSVDRITSS